MATSTQGKGPQSSTGDIDPTAADRTADRHEAPTRVLQATQSFVCMIEGRQYVVNEGQTRVSADHELVKHHPRNFAPVENNLSFQEETATRDPGEHRARG